MNRSVKAPLEAVAAGLDDGEPKSLAELMALAFDMEREAAQRYAEFADAMEIHNNREVAGLFRRMARVEQGHADAIMSEMGWREAPGPAAWDPATPEGPETPSLSDMHYLMWPYHALEVALACEERAERFYGRIADCAEVESVRNAARALQDEEREHVALIRAWMDRVEKPGEGWADDPDPPRYTD